MLSNVRIPTQVANEIDLLGHLKHSNCALYSYFTLMDEHTFTCLLGLILGC